MAKYKIKINPLPKMTLLSLVILLIAFFQQNKALSNDFNNYSHWLNNVLIPKISKDLEDDSIKEVIKDISLNRPQFEKLNQTKHAIRIKDFTFPESYFNETRLKARAYYAKSLKIKHNLLLREIEKKYRVPPDILLAIWAMESDFGRVKLKFPTVNTLTFQVYASHRSGFFYRELLQLIKLLKKEKISYDELYGSSLGAMGQPQFMPSSYNRFAVDFDSDGKKDIWKNEKDVLASIANFLNINGWINNLEWGTEIKSTSPVLCYLEGPDNAKPISSWYDTGIKNIQKKLSKSFHKDTQTSLLYPKGEYGPRFLVTKNFYVLKTYNNSDLYALYVAHLSDRIRGHNGAFRTGWEKTSPLTQAEIFNLQNALIDNGLNVGTHDGLIGHKTRRAIGLWQERQQENITCFPNK